MNYARIGTALLALTIAGCRAGSSTVGTRPDGDGRSKLWLTASNGGDTVTLTVNYEKGKTAAPRVADIRIAHSEVLALASSVAGTSAVAAGKELTTQAPTPGLVRLVLLSRDTRELGAGTLAKLTFRRVAAGPVKLDIVMDKPVFAPPESMQGLVMGNPIEL
jgi:hypothetical protein